MKSGNRNNRSLVKALALGALFLPIIGCGPGTVYVGVAAPGPWVGYPPGAVYPAYPGVYGRPWYSPEEDAPEAREAEQAANEESQPQGSEDTGNSKEGMSGEG